MPHNFDDIKHVMPADRDHAWCGVSPWEAIPVGGEPEVPHGLAKDLYGNAAAAEQAARTAFGMIDNSRDVGNPFTAIHSRIAFDRRCYLVGTSAIGLGVALMLGALLWLGPSWLRPTAPHVALDDAWCMDFRHALSCPNAQNDARK